MATAYLSAYLPIPCTPTPVDTQCVCTDLLLRRSDCITNVLSSLHWLRVPERIQFNIAVLAYKVLHGIAPRYLGPLVRVFNLPGRRCLHSAWTDRLHGCAIIQVIQY